MKQHTKGLIDEAEKNQRWTKRDHAIHTMRMKPRPRHIPKGVEVRLGKERITQERYQRDVEYIDRQTGEVIHEETISLDFKQHEQALKANREKWRSAKCA